MGIRPLARSSRSPVFQLNDSHLKTVAVRLRFPRRSYTPRTRQGNGRPQNALPAFRPSRPRLDGLHHRYDWAARRDFNETACKGGLDSLSLYIGILPRGEFCRFNAHLVFKWAWRVTTKSNYFGTIGNSASLCLGKQLSTKPLSDQQCAGSGRLRFRFQFSPATAACA